jgi:hypothetical protein
MVRMGIPKRSGILEELPKSNRAKLRKQASLVWTPPMLATLTGQAFSRPEWLFEPKLDAERCLAIHSGDQVQQARQKFLPTHDRSEAEEKHAQSNEWEYFRNRWEYSHIFRAVLSVISLVTLTVAVAS